MFGNSGEGVGNAFEEGGLFGKQPVLVVLHINWIILLLYNSGNFPTVLIRKGRVKHGQYLNPLLSSFTFIQLISGRIIVYAIGYIYFLLPLETM